MVIELAAFLSFIKLFPGNLFYSMLLTPTNIIYYLLDRGLANTASFVEGKFSCRQGESRHSNFIINKEYDDGCYFIKQAFANEEKKASLRREGMLYEIIAGNENTGSLKSYLPGFRFIDNSNAALVLDYLTGYSSMYDRLFYENKIGNTDALTGELASALFALHTIHENSPGLAEGGFFTGMFPWILRLPGLKNMNGFMARSEAEEEGMRLIFSIPGFMELAEQAAQLWQPAAIIHGDAKLNNFLIADNRMINELFSIKIIDWELVGVGDPLWDLATVFQSVLTIWVISEDPLYKKANSKIFDTIAMQQFISGCWTKYAGLHSWDASASKKKLETCTAFTAMRLLHACFESTPGARSLRPYSARLLQLAHNILLDPVAAGEHLLGVKMNT